MITFKQFLFEGTALNRTKEISAEEAISLMKQHCMVAIKAGSALYRGGPNRPIMLGDTAIGPDRVSANTLNYYTLFIDNSPAWKAFPKRSRSFIGSASIHEAYDSGNGDKHLMIPFDDVKIGVCPENDLWASFKRLKSYKLDSLNELMNLTHAIFKKLNLGHPKTFAELKTALKAATGDAIAGADLYHGWSESVSKVSKQKSLYDVFEDVLTPDDFTLCDAKTVSAFRGKGKEVFVQGKAIFISTYNTNQEITEFLDSVNPIMTHYLK